MWPMHTQLHACTHEAMQPMYTHMPLKHQLGALLESTITNFLHYRYLHVLSNPVNLVYWVIIYGYFHKE
jgi:hypothetical protein